MADQSLEYTYSICFEPFAQLKFDSVNFPEQAPILRFGLLFFSLSLCKLFPYTAKFYFVLFLYFF